MVFIVTLITPSLIFWQPAVLDYKGKNIASVWVTVPPGPGLTKPDTTLCLKFVMCHLKIHKKNV